MRFVQRTVIALFLFSAGQSTLTASMPVYVEKRCPVGGKIFEYDTVSSYTTIGIRPDGKPYGYTHFPLNLAECPENGLVLFDDFSESEIAKLEPLIKSAAFRSLRKSETQYYRAYWLATQLGRAKVQTDNLLMQAIWETDDNPSQRRKYLRLYADTAQRPVNDASENALWSALILANARRELGEFAAAQTILSSIVFPAEPKAEPQEKWRHEVWRQSIDYAQKFAKVIERGDRSSEPLDMLPEMIAAEKCWQAKEMYSGFTKTFCSQPDMVKRMEIFSPERQAESYAAADEAINAAQDATNAAEVSLNAMEAAANASAASDTPIPQ